MSGVAKEAEKDDDLDVDLEARTPPSTHVSASLTITKEQHQKPKKTNTVDWDGPNDSENPKNWSDFKKWGAIGLVSVMTFMASIDSSIFVPGVQELMIGFKSSSEILATFVVSIYVLGFALGPLVIAPLSELFGRLYIYHTCNILFIVFNVACAKSTSIGMLIVFRLLAGCVGGAPITLGGATIADLMPPEHVGKAMRLWVLGPCIGPVIGPIAGGFLAEAEGWRWTFWVMSIFGGVVTAIAFLVLRETYGPTILARKARRLRKETGCQELGAAGASDNNRRDLFVNALLRPLKLLFMSPIVFCFAVYVAIAYAYLYLLFTTFTPVYEQIYGFSVGIAGLTYIGFGLGCVIGLFTYGIWNDREVRIHMPKGTFKPEMRLPPLILGSVAMPIGLFWYGWSAYEHTHWIVPIIGSGFIGFGIVITMLGPNNYLLDAYTTYAASAMAANAVFRSLVAAFLPLAGRPMYNKLDNNWGNSLLGFIALALLPIPLLFMKYGERLRTKYVPKL